MTYKDREDYKHLPSSVKTQLGIKIAALIRYRKEALKIQKELDVALTNRGLTRLYCAILEEVNSRAWEEYYRE